MSDLPRDKDFMDLLPNIKDTKKRDALNKMLIVVRNSANIVRSPYRGPTQVTPQTEQAYSSLISALQKYIDAINSALQTCDKPDADELRRKRQRSETEAKAVAGAYEGWKRIKEANENPSKSHREAIEKALKWLDQHGVKLKRAWQKESGFGMESDDGNAGYRLEFDDNHGAHINVYCEGKGNKFTYTFPGDRGVVKALYRQLFQWDATHKIYSK